MPVISTQTEPIWDVIDKLNKEFDELHSEYLIEKDTNYLHARLAHKKSYHVCLEKLMSSSKIKQIHRSEMLEERLCVYLGERRSSYIY